MSADPRALLYRSLDPDEAQRLGYGRLGILGTRWLMEGPVYRDVLTRRGLDHRIPTEGDRETIDRAIFEELVNGVFRDETRVMFHEQIRKLGREQGCEAAILGCTEIPLIVDPESAALPTLDSTRLLARAALGRALEGTAESR